MPPKVSVIIPTYNRASLVGRAIRSVLNQTYKDFEIIVVDDCSNDNTEEVVKSFDDSRIRYIRHNKNRGGSAARNTGIKKARGEYIAFLDDDDEWLPNKLEKQIKLFESLPKEYGAVYSGCYIAQNGVIKKVILPKFRGNVYYHMLKSCFINSPTIVVRRECFKKSGLFDESLPACQDWDMWIRIAKNYKFEFISEPLAIYHIHGNQIKFNPKKYVYSVKRILNKYYDDYKKYPNILSSLYKYIGVLYYIADDKESATKYILKSIKLNLFQNGFIHLLLMNFLPKIYKKLLLKRY